LKSFSFALIIWYLYISGMIKFSNLTPEKRKSLRYFGFLFIILISLELLFNFSAVIFSNTTDRVKLKSAMFEFRGETEVLFLGSSRFKDGISPNLYSKQLLENSGTTYRGFNGAITGANIERLEYFFNKAVEKEGVKHIVIEISMPQLSRKTADIEDANEKEDLDSKLSDFFADKSKLIRWRKSLRFDNLKNAPAILFADYMEGSELYRKGAFSDMFDDDEITVDTHILKTWNPSIIHPNNEPISIKKYEFVLKAFKNMMHKANAKHINVVLVIPPIVNARKLEESQKETLDLYQSVANLTQNNIFNFAELDIPETYFRDQDSHLNKDGRDLFSIKIADIMIQHNLIKQ